jgi:hypothetical protein
MAKMKPAIVPVKELPREHFGRLMKLEESVRTLTRSIVIGGGARKRAKKRRAEKVRGAP